MAGSQIRSAEAKRRRGPSVVALTALCLVACSSYVGGAADTPSDPNDPDGGVVRDPRQDAALAEPPDTIADPETNKTTEKDPITGVEKDVDEPLDDDDVESDPDVTGLDPAVRARFVSINTRNQTVLSDLRSLLNPSDRLRARYLDLTPLANAGVRGDQLETYREAVFFILNSLSLGRNTLVPRALDESRLLYRVDLRDIGWDANTWRLLEQAYPYAAIYDDNSRLFQSDELIAEQLRDQTGTQIPVIQGDWFVSHASRPPLYYQLLDLPNTVQGLEVQLGVDLDDDVASESVQRAGFSSSTLSPNNRVIERHERGASRGALWRGFEFANNLDQRNIFANPLDFVADGVEIMFELDNGLSAYFLADAAGRRRDKAPNELLRDPLSRDGAAEVGLSCMSCHQEDGPIARDDEVRAVVDATAGAALRAAVQGVYADKATLDESFERDQDRYRSARSSLGIENLVVSSLHTLDDTHFGGMTLATAASVLGIEASVLKRALDATPQSFPPEFLVLRVREGAIRRDAFDVIVDDVLEGLGLGTQLRVLPQAGQVR